MPDHILINGDKALFNPNFGAAVVVVQPGTLIGSGSTNIGGQAVCVEGNEDTVKVPGCTYIAGSYSIPGVGTLSIDSLGADQTSKQTNSGGKATLLKGSVFTAKFQVTVPAQQPSGTTTIPDSTPQYTGSGQFVTANTSVKGR